MLELWHLHKVSERLTIDFEAKGESIPLCFNFGAIDALQQKWGAHFDNRMNEMFKGTVSHVPYVASLLSGKPQEFFEDGVPLAPLINAIVDAYALGWRGVRLGTDTGDKDTSEKKSFLTRWVTWLKGIFKGGSKRAERGWNFGD